jgi:hypothetical protein
MINLGCGTQKNLLFGIENQFPKIERANFFLEPAGGCRWIM